MDKHIRFVFILRQYLAARPVSDFVCYFLCSLATELRASTASLGPLEPPFQEPLVTRQVNFLLRKLLMEALSGALTEQRLLGFAPWMLSPRLIMAQQHTQPCS
jgi:hypothetical protein